MKKYELLKSDSSVIRVLEITQDKTLIIDCIKRTMPVWVDSTVLDAYLPCSTEELIDATSFSIVDIDSIDAKQRELMHNRYTLIAPTLPFIADSQMRSTMITSISEENNISKQTIRRYLCLYLAFMDISVLAPKEKKIARALTVDEKNMRWALNKFFYTRKKNSLKTAYTMMLKEKYCNSLGELAEQYPSFYQFRYFYRKTRKLQNYYISRNGLTNYQRNSRPLTGSGVQEFAPTIGTAMLDSTICDIYLVDDIGNLIGRPILTACIDAYSSLCCGYYLSWEGGVYSLRGLLQNVITDKTEWCKKFGISIHREDWNCNLLPAVMVTDMGKEYTSENFEQISELGVTLINLPPYRPELKGTVEKFFDLVQKSYKKYLKGKGVIETDYQERGAHDYRKDACLTMKNFEKVLLYCIIYYNSQRIIENFPYTEEMIAAEVKPHASAIWNLGIRQIGANLIPVTEQQLLLTLLPRTNGRFSRNGLKVNGLRYHCDGYAEQYLKGGTVTVAYHSEDVSSVWLLENGTYTEFTLIESRFKGKELTAVQQIQSNQRAIVRDSEKENLQAQIHLAQHIETIVQATKLNTTANLKEGTDND